MVVDFGIFNISLISRTVIWRSDSIMALILSSWTSFGRPERCSSLSEKSPERNLSNQFWHCVSIEAPYGSNVIHIRFTTKKYLHRSDQRKPYVQYIWKFIVKNCQFFNSSCLKSITVGRNSKGKSILTYIMLYIYICKEFEIFLWKKRRFQLRWDTIPGLSVPKVPSDQFMPKKTCYIKILPDLTSTNVNLVV